MEKSSSVWLGTEYDLWVCDHWAVAALKTENGDQIGAGGSERGATVLEDGSVIRTRFAGCLALVCLQQITTFSSATAVEQNHDIWRPCMQSFH